MKQLLGGFRDFVMRGNVLDLAVAVILGVAFGAVVQAFTDNVLMAFVAAIFGEANFDQLTWSVGDGVVAYGTFITAIVNFLIVAVALYAIIKSFEALQSRRGAEKVEESPAPSDEAIILAEIRDLLRAG